MMDRTSNLNRFAIFCLVMAKVAGVAGIALAYCGFRTIGGPLLVVDGVMLVLALALCCWAGQTTNRQDETDREVIARMMRDGTLRSCVKELERSKE